jgi:hypothetical protein
MIASGTANIRPNDVPVLIVDATRGRWVESMCWAVRSENGGQQRPTPSPAMPTPTARTAAWEAAAIEKMPVVTSVAASNKTVLVPHRRTSGAHIAKPRP